MDQVPLPFSCGDKRTLNAVGEACEMKQPTGSSSNKRFCTIQVTICADTNQTPIKIELIFRGQGKRLSKQEKTLYESLPNVIIRWQEKAWCDEGIALDYLTSFREQTLDLGHGEVLLGMDNHTSQSTPYCRQFMWWMCIVPAFTPPNCTDSLSPVDHNVGQNIKQKISKLYDEDYENNPDSWELSPSEGGMTESSRRMLVARWTSKAWSEVSKNETLIKSAFVRTGFLVAKDGSENHLIQLWKGSNVGPDGQPYTF